MQPLQGKNWFLLASPQGGAPLALGYYMQPCGAKKQTPGTHLPEDPRPKENPYKVQWENCHCYCGHNPFLNADYVHDLIITKDSDMDLETIELGNSASLSVERDRVDSGSPCQNPAGQRKGGHNWPLYSLKMLFLTGKRPFNDGHLYPLLRSAHASKVLLMTRTR